MAEKRFRDADGSLLCDRCHGPIEQPATGRRRLYCSRTCRELAYRERKTLGRIADAVLEASAQYAAEPMSAAEEREAIRRGVILAPLVSSVDETQPNPVTSVDETRMPPPRRLPAGMGIGMLFVPPPPHDD